MYVIRKSVFTLVSALLLGLAGCGSGRQAQNDTTASNESTQGSSEQTDQEGRHPNLTTTTAEADGPQELTPIVAQVPYAPIPFAGSDSRTHLVYELETTNFSNGETTIEQLEVLDADSTRSPSPARLPARTRSTRPRARLWRSPRSIRSRRSPKPCPWTRLWWASIDPW